MRQVHAQQGDVLRGAPSHARGTPTRPPTRDPPPSMTPCDPRRVHAFDVKAPRPSQAPVNSEEDPIDSLAFFPGALNTDTRVLAFTGGEQASEW